MGAFCVTRFCHVDASHSSLSLTPLLISEVCVKIYLSLFLRYCQL